MKPNTVNELMGLIADFQIELDEKDKRLQTLEELLHEVAASGTEVDDERIPYMVIQVGRETMAEIRAALENQPPAPKGEEETVIAPSSEMLAAIAVDYILGPYDGMRSEYIDALAQRFRAALGEE